MPGKRAGERERESDRQDGSAGTVAGTVLTWERKVGMNWELSSLTEAERVRAWGNAGIGENGKRGSKTGRHTHTH